MGSKRAKRKRRNGDGDKPVSSDEFRGPAATKRAPSSLIEDGYNYETHGGARLHDVEGFDSKNVFTSGLGGGGQLPDEFLNAPDAGDIEYDLQEDACDGEDDRARIDAEITRVPYRMICRLLITRADGGLSGGTGWFAAPRIVVTAGHCVYSHAARGWAQSIEVAPAMNGADEPYPFGALTSSKFQSVEKWITKAPGSETGNPKFDYGCIILPDDSLGNKTGWFGFASLADAEFNRKPLAHISGYPQDKSDSGSEQWFSADRIQRHTKRRLYYKLDTYFGSSGSPVWRYKNGKLHVIGIHSYGGCPNKAVRITGGVFNTLKKWKKMGES